MGSKNTIESNRKIAAPNKQIHDRSLSWLGTGFSIKSDGVKLILCILNEQLAFINIDLKLLRIVGYTEIASNLVLFVNYGCLIRLVMLQWTYLC